MLGAYTSYKGANTEGMAQGLQLGQNATAASFKEALAGIGNLLKTAEKGYVEDNTLKVQEYLRNKIAQRGLGILANPVDQEAELSGFGNLVDKAAIAKTTTDFTERIKNEHINRASAGADEILVQTGDPIKAREHLKQGLIVAGAPSTFADAEAVNYDLRKATEIKNIGVRDAQTEDIAVASIMDAGKTGGYQSMKTVATKAAENIAPYKRAAFNNKMAESIEKISTPTQYDSNNVNSALAAWKEETANTLKTKLENRQQLNDQKLSVSDSTSNSIGSEGGSRSTKKDKTSGALGPDLIDSKGKVNPSVANALGNHVSNFFEKMSRTNDSAVIKALHKDVADSVGSEEVAGNILGQAFSYAYKGDSWTGNDLSPKDIEDMKKKASELAQAHHDKAGTGTSTSNSSSRSTSRSGNISFTNADDITQYVAERKKGELLFASKLNEAARNNKLGVTDYDGVQRLIDTYASSKVASASSPPATTTIMNVSTKGQPSVSKLTGDSSSVNSPVGRPGAAARVDKYFKENSLQDAKKGDAGGGSVEDRVANMVAKNEERKNKIKGAAKQVAPQAAPEVPNETASQRFEREKLERKVAYKELSDKTDNFFKRKSNEYTDEAKIKAGQVQVVDPKYGKVWVDKATAKLKYGYKG